MYANYVLLANCSFFENTMLNSAKNRAYVACEFSGRCKCCKCRNQLYEVQ